MDNREKSELPENLTSTGPRLLNALPSDLIELVESLGEDESKPADEHLSTGPRLLNALPSDLLELVESLDEPSCP